MEIQLPLPPRLRHRPLLGFLLSLTALGLFGFIALQIGEGSGLSHLDYAVAERLAAHREESPFVRSTFWVITQWGDVLWFAGLGVVVGVLLLVWRRGWLALAWGIALCGGGLLDGGLKDFFRRPRPAPPLRDAWIHTTTSSFPSGHSVGSEVAYVFLAYLLLLLIPQHWARWIAASGLGLLILAIGFSRMYLGAHWCSDVVGGYLIGAAWVSAAITIVETIRRRRQP